MDEKPRASWLAAIGPGILLTAASVGAGDLLISTLAGSEVGLLLLWCVPFGVVLKWVISEGIARWQMATDTSRPALSIPSCGGFTNRGVN